MLAHAPKKHQTEVNVMEKAIRLTTQSIARTTPKIQAPLNVDIKKDPTVGSKYRRNAKLYTEVKKIEIDRSMT